MQSTIDAIARDESVRVVVMMCNMMTGDAQEGTGAFAQKRKPQWKGR